MKALPLILLVLLCLACVACSAEPGEGAQQAMGTAADPAGLPDLPAGRRAGGLLSTELDGSQTFSRSPLASADGSLLTLSSAEGELAWAIWELPAQDELRYLDFDLSASVAAGEVHLALADFSSGRWELLAPGGTGAVLQLDPLRHSSPGGLMYAAALASGGASADISRLKLLAFHSNAAPSADLQADIAGGDAPLAVQFDASGSADPEGGIERYLWDFEGDGGFELTTFEPVFSHVYQLPGIFNATVAVEDSEGERASASVEINVTLPGNNPPEAVISDSISLGGFAPYTLNTDADNSNAGGDPGDSIVLYEWDFNGDGSWDSSSQQPQVQHLYPYIGDFTLGLRVTDSAGNQALDSSKVRVSVAPQTVATSGQLNSVELAMVQGNPALVYADNDQNMLIYIRALDPLGQTWGAQVTAAGGVEPGDIDLEVVNGVPAISFCNLSSFDLNYVRATTSTGSVWAAPLTLDSTGQTGYRPSLRVINGRPAIAYLSLSSDELRYIRSNDASGLAWPAHQVLDSDGLVGLNQCLFPLGDRPVISYTHQTDQDLLFIEATDADGSAWGSRQVLDSVGAVGGDSHIFLASESGPLLIVYEDETDPGMKKISSNNPLLLNWNQPQRVAEASFGANEISSAIVNGTPALVFNDGQLIYYLHSFDTFANSWSETAEIGSEDSISSLLVCGGDASIAGVDTFFGVGTVSFLRWD
ncbi:PKD domain-containing protein [bacterium]|nr:PKD domain-containing protein [bacterium]